MATDEVKGVSSRHPTLSLQVGHVLFIEIGRDSTLLIGCASET